MDSQVYEDMFPATKKANLDKETDVGKFDVSCEMNFMLRNWYIQNPQA